MNNYLLLRGGSLFAAVCLAVLTGAYTASAETDTKDTLPVSIVSSEYQKYLDLYSDAAHPGQEISADMYSAETPDGQPQRMPDGNDGDAAYLIEEDGMVTWSVSVPEPGFYNLRIDYMTVPGKDADIECAVYINGKIPFSSASSMALSRVWRDGDPIGVGSQNDEYRPVQVEQYGWYSGVLTAFGDYMDNGYLFYFSGGEHTVGLACVRESMIVRGVTLFHEQEPDSYEEYLAQHAREGRVPETFTAEPVFIEGETAEYKSHPTLYSSSDYSSCATSPYDPRRSLQNVIGGESWAQSGQWMEWSFDVKVSGFYQLSMRVKQNYKSGSYSVRRCYIDESVPFAEAAKMLFPYGLGWDLVSLGGQQPAYIWLDKGLHTLRLEAVLGGFSDICGEVNYFVSAMNTLYRKIMMVTGSIPDALRDYKLERLFPESPALFSELSQSLYRMVDLLAEMTGGKGAETAILEKTALQMADFSRDVEGVPARLKAFNDNISGVAAWLAKAVQQPLMLDYILLSPPDSELPAADAPWYKAVFNEVVRFFYSFFEDYDNIRSNIDTDKQPITLWLGSGRDQATAMQSVITDLFSAKYGIPVNLRLIDMNVLMRAVAGGTGPDLALYQDQSTVINYALRGAAYDLSQFEDIDEVAQRFAYEATVPFRLNDKLYALPENINYNVLFYRSDVLAELGLGVPETWDQIYSALTVLQKNKLQLGMTSSFNTASSTAISPLFLALLYQHGGSVYDSEGKLCVLNGQTGVDAFTEYCGLYTKYGLPLKLDLLTRFRTGEAPIVINNFSFGSELAVSAPEISGLWGMALLPGTPDGENINHATTMTASGTVMFSNARSKADTWTFIKWWTGAQAQTEYARRIEGALGRSGRWTSANLEAMADSLWSKEELSVLNRQLGYAKALPEVAGGYYTGRSINNAIRTVVNNKSNPKETLYEYIKDINKEITQKRRELGLSVNKWE